MATTRDCNAATKVFKDFFVHLMEGLQDPDKLAVELYATDLILRTTRDQVTQITLTREQKNTHLLAAVECQLRVNPKAFDVFLCALRERTTLDDLCKRMEEAYCQPSAVYARSTSSETDSFNQNQVPASGSKLTPFSENATIPLVTNHASRVFPYLNMGKMNEQQKLVLQGKLLEDSDNIMAKFSDVIHYTINSLKANPAVCVETLSTRVASLGAYKPIRAQKPLLRDQLKEIRDCSTIDGIFFILQEYYSFFNYGIILRIVTWFGTPDDKQRLEEYSKHFKEFCKRRTFECPPDIFGRTSDDKSDKSTLVVKTEDSWDPSEESRGKILEQVVRLRTTLAKVLEVECETLYLCRIDKGCVELMFQVPSFVQRDIFPLSREQERSLIKIEVASLICGSYTFSRQVLTVGEDSNGNDSSDGEVNRQQQNSDSDIESERTLRKKWLLASDLALEEALQNIGGEEDSSDSEVDRRQENDDADIESERTLMSQRLYPCASSYTRQERLSAVHETRTPNEMPSIKTILEDDRSLLMFRRFLKDQCITRNLNFWLACEHFRQLPLRDNQEHLKEVGRAIYVKFIKPSAAQHITILDRTKRNIKLSLEFRSQVTPQLFATAQQEIYNVMEENEFRQFLVSDFFPDCSVFTNLDSQVSAAVYSPSMANPAYGVCGGGSLQHSGSEDSASITSFSTDSEAKHYSSRNAMSDTESSEAKPYSSRNAMSDTESSEAKPYFSRNAMSDTESSRRNRPQQAGPHITKDKPVTQEKFGALLYDRLQAVQKDREAMEKKARDRARKQGKSYNEIMAIEWFDLPEAAKYIKFEPSTPSSRAETSNENGQLRVPSVKHTLSPSQYSPSGTPQTSLSQKAMAHINSLALREVQDALKDLEIMEQVNKKSWSHKPTGSAYSSSVLSTTSDSGVGDTLATSDLATPSSSVQAYLHRQNMLTRSMPERDRQAQAAAIALISNSPQPDQLDWVTQSMPQPVNRERHRSRQAHQFVNYPRAYSSDDSSSCFTMTSQSSTSDLFIPRSRRLPPQFHSDSGDPHHFSHGRHYPPRRLTTPKRSHLVHTHKPSPPSIAERGMTPQRQSDDILVVYHLDDFPTPYAKRIAGMEVTLAEFKEKVFARKGEYRYFFKSFCEDLGMEIMEEYSDDGAVLPHTQGKIMGRVEKVA